MRSVRRITVILFLFSTFLAAADSPFAGTWKYNPAKSKSIPPAAKSSTARVEADDTNFKLSQEFVDDKGQSTTVNFETKFDGMKSSVTGSRDIEGVSVRRMGDRTIVLTFTKGDKVVARNKFVVAKGGKSGTLYTTDLSEAKPKKGRDVYEKQ